MFFTFMHFGEKWTEILSQYISWILNTVDKFKMIVPYSKWLNGWTVTYLVAVTAMIVGAMTANFYDRHRHDCQFMTAINYYYFYYSYMIINYHRRSHSHLFVIIVTICIINSSSSLSSSSCIILINIYYFLLL